MKLKGKAKAAFLRRMAKGRNKKHHKSKKRKHSKHSTGGHQVKRRHHSKKHRKSTRRRHHAGALSKYIPPTPTLIGLGTAFAYGKLERAASTDQQHFINKVPAVVPQIGRTGNIGAIAWLAGVVTRHPVIKSVAGGILHVAAYQNGRGAGFTKDAPDFKMGAPQRPGRGRDELLVEQYLRNQDNR